MFVKMLSPLAAAVLAALCFTFTAPEANARPKSVHHICGDADADKIQDPRSQACLDKMQQDILNGVPNPHYLVCLKDGGVSCCQDQGSSGARKCDRIFRTAISGSTAVGGDLAVNPGDQEQPASPDTGKIGGRLKVK